MFGVIFGRFGRGKKVEEATTSDRDIYEFHDGIQDRREDPLSLWNRLWTDSECIFEDDLKAMNSGQLEIVQRVCGLVRRAFEIRRLADGGLTDLECLALLTEFLQYADGLKKKHGPLPMPSRFLESALRAKLRNDSTTPPAADSFSTPNESPAAEPMPSSNHSAPFSPSP